MCLRVARTSPIQIVTPSAGPLFGLAAYHQSHPLLPYPEALRSLTLIMAEHVTVKLTSQAVYLCFVFLIPRW